eukprot:8384085-Lingulodinium_polyedra.AAC.1
MFSPRVWPTSAGFPDGGLPELAVLPGRGRGCGRKREGRGVRRGRGRPFGFGPRRAGRGQRSPRVTGA